MTQNAPHINHHRPRHLVLAVGLLLLVTQASACTGNHQRQTGTTPKPGTTKPQTSTAQPETGAAKPQGGAAHASAAGPRVFMITYAAHNGVSRQAELLLPAWYTRSDNPPIPLVISPHGRGGKGSSNGKFWGTLPSSGGFAVVNPDGMGRQLERFSYGYRGQIDDLARMPGFVRKALPWVHIDCRRIFALGSSMGGQETLLLVARHPGLLAGAAAMDSVTDLMRRYSQLPEIAGGTDLQSVMRREVGGTPTEKPTAYAARSPLSQARALARSGVRLQIWWSTADRIVIDQKHQSGTLFRLVKRLGPCAPVKAFVGTWRHSSEMRSTALLPLALIDFGLLPHDFRLCPPTVQELT